MDIQITNPTNALWKDLMHAVSTELNSEFKSRPSPFKTKTDPWV